MRRDEEQVTPMQRDVMMGLSGTFKAEDDSPGRQSGTCGWKMAGSQQEYGRQGHGRLYSELKGSVSIVRPRASERTDSCPLPSSMMEAYAILPGFS